jgi:hypothetical protein
MRSLGLRMGNGDRMETPTGPVNMPLPSPSGDTSNRCASARRWAIFRLADRTSRAASFSGSVLAGLRKSPAYRWRNFSMIPSSRFFDPAARLTCGHKNWRTRPHHSVVYRMWLVHRQSIGVEYYCVGTLCRMLAPAVAIVEQPRRGPHDEE